MANYSLLITQRAFADIFECVRFVNNVSNEAAKALRDEIMNSIRELETFPNAHPTIEGLKVLGLPIRKMPVHHGRYLVLYKVNEDVVTIYDVIDSRKDNSLLKI